MLPDNGKVVVIDDKPKEVQKLFAALSSEGIPFFYYQNEEGNDLPKKPLKNIRLVFLDLLLISDEKAKSKDVISRIAARLKKILSEDNGPYILIYWSTKKDEYQKALETAFDNGLKKYKPLMKLSLPKGEINDDENGLEVLKEKLEERIEKFKIFKAFLFWESIVNQSAGDHTNSLANLFPVDNEWDKNLTGIFYLLAKAYSLQELDLEDYNSIFKKAFFNLNKSFLDNIDSEIKKDIPKILAKFSTYKASPNILASLNTRLHLYFDEKLDKLNTGNVFEVDPKSHDLKKIISDSGQGGKKKLIDSNPKIIELDVTPSCDYANDKFHYIRLLPGLLFKGEFNLNNFKNNDYSYRLSPVMSLDGNSIYLFFDFRFLHSVPKDKIEKEYSDPIFRLRHEILTDIQSNLSSHINRPGIVSVF